MRIRVLWEGLRRAPRTRDALAAAAYLALGLALLQLGAARLWIFPGLPRFDLGFLLALLAMAALATQRSSRPFLVLLAGAVVTVGDALIGSSVGVVVLFGDFVYCAFRYGSDRGLRIFGGVLAAVAVAGAAAFVFRPTTREEFAGLALQWAFVIILSASWGWNVRSERVYTRAVLAAEHRGQTQRLRERIAHELHDRVANHIAVAGLNIEAARLRLDGVPGAPREIERSLDEASRGTDGAHEQLRQLIAVLTSVDELAEQTVEAVPLESLLPVGRRLVRTGADLDAALAPLDPVARGVVRRVLQELVANAAKHGAGDVSVDVAADPTVIRVENAIASGARAPGSGIGIAGAAALIDEVGARIESNAVDAQLWRAQVALAGPQEGRA